ncbi:hypothetical protein JCM15519_15340 [Fundidesulfovibrio butyratiphilus]
MNPARVLSDLGVSVSLVEDKIKLSGLDRLAPDAAARAVEVAKASRAEIIATLGARKTPIPGRDVLASLDRFFASARPHTFEDGAAGLVAPEHRPPSVEVVRCPVTGEDHPRTACTAFGGCPDLNTCRAFRRPRTLGGRNG